MAEIKSEPKKMDKAGEHLPPMKWNNQIQYRWWMDADIIFRYLKVFFDSPNLD